MKQIKVMDTSFRDGFQSVYGARVFVDDFIPALQSAVSAGIRHFETAGGARFQSPIFYCNENAFETMDKIRAAVGPDVKLQSLARGVNVVGLNSQPRDVIDLHAKTFAKHGVNVIRNFDALNDVNNLIDCTKLLQNVTMNVGDYSSCKDFIDSKTFVYIDPPYRPLTSSSSFTSYNENGFTDKEQIELGIFITEIAKQGAHIIASNSDPKNADEKDNFFDDLYSEFNIERIHASRMINSDANKRGAINELLISNIASVL